MFNKRELITMVLSLQSKETEKKKKKKKKKLTKNQKKKKLFDTAGNP